MLFPIWFCLLNANLTEGVGRTTMVSTSGERRREPGRGKGNRYRRACRAALCSAGFESRRYAVSSSPAKALIGIANSIYGLDPGRAFFRFPAGQLLDDPLSQTIGAVFSRYVIAAKRLPTSICNILAPGAAKVWCDTSLPLAARPISRKNHR